MYVLNFRGEKGVACLSREDIIQENRLSELVVG